MAQNLLINILAKDKTKQAFSSISAGLGRLRSSIFSIQSALVTGLGGVAVKSLLDTGRSVEQLGIRFNFLFGSVDEGSKAFSGLIDYAAKVPFSLEEIGQASGNLAVVSKDADDLQNILKITGNVAAVTGLDFRQTAEQIQRSFAGGIAAADVFRERGVRALLGFQAGANVTAEETIKRFEEVFGPNGRFGKATEVMAVTFDGTLSMLSDKLFKFKSETNRAGFFDFVKNALVVINRFLDENTDALARFGAKVSDSLITFIKQAMLGTARLLDMFKYVFQVIGLGIGGLFDLVKALPPGVRELGILGFLMLGKKGKYIVAGIAGLLKLFKVDLEAISEKIFGSSEATDDWGSNTAIVNKFIKEIEKNIDLSNKQMKDLLNAIKKAEEDTSKIAFNFRDMLRVLGELNDKHLKKLNDLGKMIAETLDKGISQVSESIAKTIVLGEDLKASFKELLQNILIKILATLIDVGIRLAVNFALEKMGIQVIDAKTKAEYEHAQAIEYSNEKLRRQAQLNSQSGKGGGGGGGDIGTILQIASLFFAKGGAVSKGKPIVVGEQGPELFIPNTTGQITQNARGTGTHGGVSVNFNISTLDSSNFEDMLNRNRGAITAIINDAVNEKGNRNLI